MIISNSVKFLRWAGPDTYPYVNLNNYLRLSATVPIVHCTLLIKGPSDRNMYLYVPSRSFLSRKIEDVIM
jgi:hypothetical protein